MTREVPHFLGAVQKGDKSKERHSKERQKYRIKRATTYEIKNNSNERHNERTTNIFMYLCTYYISLIKCLIKCHSRYLVKTLHMSLIECHSVSDSSTTTTVRHEVKCILWAIPRR